MTLTPRVPSLKLKLIYALGSSSSSGSTLGGKMAPKKTPPVVAPVGVPVLPLICQTTWDSDLKSLNIYFNSALQLPPLLRLLQSFFPPSLFHPFGQRLMSRRASFENGLEGRKERATNHPELVPFSPFVTNRYYTHTPPP